MLEQQLFPSVDISNLYQLISTFECQGYDFELN